MFSRLRVLTVFLLLPCVFILGTTGSASAVEPWSSVSTLHSSIVGDVRCDLNIHFGEQGTTLETAPGRCLGYLNIDGGSQRGEAGSGVRLSYSGQTPITWCAGSKDLVLTDNPSNNAPWGNVAGTIPATSMPVASDCSVTEVCIEIVPGAADTKECSQVSMNFEPPPGVGLCQWGTPYNVEQEVYLNSVNGSFDNYKTRIRFSLHGETPPGVRWHVSAFKAADQTSTSQFATVNRLNGEALDFVFSSEVSIPNRDPITGELMETQPPNAFFAGAEIAAGLTGWNTSSADPKARVYAALPKLPPGPTDNYGGWTDAQHCRFWFGPKRYNVDGTDGDQPAGQLDEKTAPPELPPEPPTDPEVEDEPSFWGAILAVLRAIWGAISTGLQAVVTAVGRVVTAIAGLADDIGDAIADALEGVFEGLFVPADGFMEERFDNVQNNWDQTSPARYLDVFSTYSLGGSASGCSGVPLDVELPGGVAINESIGSACDGGMASAAGVVRVVLSASFIIGGVWACVRAVGSGFGWNPGVGERSVS